MFCDQKYNIIQYNKGILAFPPFCLHDKENTTDIHLRLEPELIFQDDQNHPGSSTIKSCGTCCENFKNQCSTYIHFSLPISIRSTCDCTVQLHLSLCCVTLLTSLFISNGVTSQTFSTSVCDVLQTPSLCRFLAKVQKKQSVICTKHNCRSFFFFQIYID